MRKHIPFEAYTLNLTGSGGDVVLIEVVGVVYETGYLPGDGRGQHASRIHVSVDGLQTGTFDDLSAACEHIATSYPTATPL